MTIFDQASSQWLASLGLSSAVLKVFAFFIAWLIIWLPFAVPIAILLKWRPFKPLTVKQKLPLLATLYLVVPIIVWGAFWIEGAAVSDYGLGCKDITCNFFTILVSILVGLGLGVLSLAILFAIEYRFGWVKWRWEDQPLAVNVESPPQIVVLARSTLLSTLFLGLWISGTEELVFRGFLLNQFRQEYSPWVAAAVSSLIFALLHLVWEQEKTVPQLPGLWLMGMVLVLARWVNGDSLGLAWGLHTGWIWVMASLDATGLIVYTGSGATWITGIAGKPLAGGASLLLLLTTGVLLWSFIPRGAAHLIKI